MNAHLRHEGADTFVVCEPCGMERYEPNRATAQRLMTEHNHTKHKEK